jgi:hypothetical protein
VKLPFGLRDADKTLTLVIRLVIALTALVSALKTFQH